MEPSSSKAILGISANAGGSTTEATVNAAVALSCPPSGSVTVNVIRSGPPYQFFGAVMVTLWVLGAISIRILTCPSACH